MRLIDADLLKQNCKCTGGFNDNFMCVDLITLAEVIDNQPTAFDMEKVVGELESLSNAEADYYYARSNDVIDREDAIDIVKKGGVE